MDDIQYLIRKSDKRLVIVYKNGTCDIIDDIEKAKSLYLFLTSEELKWHQ